MRKLGWIAGTIVVAALAGPVVAMQGAASPEHQAALKKLQHWVGVWQGTGWAQLGPTGRHPYAITETVQSRLEGTVILVEGLGKEIDEKTGKEAIIHNALGIVYFDPGSKQYRIRAHTFTGSAVESEVKLADGKLEWGFKEPRSGMTIRFTARIDGQKWNEVGESSQDGKTWTKFMEMNLEKQK